MLKRNCALYFLYNFLLPGVWKQYFEIEDNVSYTLDLCTQYLNAWMPFKSTRRYIAILGTRIPCNMFTLSKSFLSGSPTHIGPEKTQILFNFILLPDVTTSRKWMNSKKNCNRPLTLASLTSLGSLTAIEIQFWICFNATKVLNAC